MADENIQVVCRVRPSDKQRARLCYGPDGTEIIIDEVSHERRFGFNRVFTESATQLSVYSEVAAPLVDALVDGINAAVIAYGQTGSGKTHTMHGSAEPGITPRLLDDLFRRVMNCDPNEEYDVRATYVQIYNEKVYDLLEPKPGSRPQALVLKELGTTLSIPQARTVPVRTMAEVNGLLFLGNKNRMVGATLMNEQSSRSHSILMVTVEKHEKLSGLRKVSALYLVDLAGSENAQRTGAERERLEEGKNINKSLQALKRVIFTLVDKARLPPDRARQLHVPFRDSTLTRVLQNAVAGSSRTRVVICVSPDDVDSRETVSSLEFGQLTSTLRNNVRQNVHRSVEELQEEYQEAQNTLLRLREVILQLQRKLSIAPAAPREGTRIPEQFICPLTGQVFENPVVCENGHTYSRRAVVTYLRKTGRLPESGRGRLAWTDEDEESDEERTDPKALGLMLPNYNLAEQIDAWRRGKAPLRPRSFSTAHPTLRPYHRIAYAPARCAAELPADCVNIVCAFLLPHSLHAVSRTCMRWQECADADHLWLVHIRREFNDQTYNPLLSSAKEKYFRLALETARQGTGPRPTTFVKGAGFALVRPQ